MTGDNAEVVSAIVSAVSDIMDEKFQTELHLQNDIDKNIQLLVENCIPASQKFEKTTRQVQSMQQDIDVLKDVVTEHSRKISKIS